jgi:hypothetical protein
MGVYGDMSFNPQDEEKPLSAHSNKELLKICQIKSSEDEFFRNMDYDEEERREYLLEMAGEKNSQIPLCSGKKYPL